MAELMYTVTKIEICHMVPHNFEQDPQYRRQTKLNENKKIQKGNHFVLENVGPFYKSGNSERFRTFLIKQNM